MDLALEKPRRQKLDVGALTEGSLTWLTGFTSTHFQKLSERRQRWAGKFCTSRRPKEAESHSGKSPLAFKSLTGHTSTGPGFYLRSPHKAECSQGLYAPFKTGRAGAALARNAVQVSVLAMGSGLLAVF